ncbi:hypothetical protein Hypma_000453 [Hypsizygus marmoreus]|uniref:MYND-type domain-containing protein n=1 Tax=Hypsizygus marmoreus TaxID=39966 RepID=A0A369JEW2_HYPMA|nr:hypothetical protein Hypma_000453 [Hypsizygus marmoreus]
MSKGRTTVCAHCATQDAALRCSRCKSRVYCAKECQAADWPAHKRLCAPPSENGSGATRVWYDKYRKTQAKDKHFGKLELVTWDGQDEDGERLGWGATIAEETSDMRTKFYEELKGDEEKFFKYWPRAFRWTCCGLEGGRSFGCDHHGTGPSRCSCDFCVMGKPLPNSIYNTRTTWKKGLNIPRGPDPRSYNLGLHAITEVSRSIFSLPM